MRAYIVGIGNCQYKCIHIYERLVWDINVLTFEDVDVNSFQTLYGRRRFCDSTSSNDESGGKDGKIRYLDKTKSSGSIIRGGY